MSNFHGKTAFVSGATGGIGRSVAVALAESGCNLFLTATDSMKLQEFASELLSYQIDVSTCAGDLNSKHDIYKIIDAAAATSPIDILVNSAGVFPYISLLDASDEDFDKVLNVNFRSAFMFARAFSSNMVEKKWGRIVNVGSSSAYSGFRDTSLYCSSKHALLGFSKAIHDELKEHNVRTYFISPSSTKSKMGRETVGQDYSTFLEPDDVAKYIVFAISFDSNVMSEEIFLKRMVVR